METVIDHDELVAYIQQRLYGVGWEVDEDLVHMILDLEIEFLDEKGLIEYE